MAVIVSYVHRYKRPPKKRKSVALDGPAIVRKRSNTEAVPPQPVEDQRLPANDDC